MKRIVLTCVLLVLIGPRIAGAALATPIGVLSEMLSAMNTPSARCGETTLGNVAADAVRMVAGADIAILNGGDFRGNLRGGEVSYEDILAVFSDNKPLAAVVISPAELKSILEQSVSHMTTDIHDRIDLSASAYDGFPQISGFSFRYDISAVAGQRVLNIVLNDGTEPDLTVTSVSITLAATEFMLSGGYGMPVFNNARALDTTLAESLAAYIYSSGTVDEPALNRISYIGSLSGAFASGVGSRVIIIVAAIVICFGVIKVKGGATPGRK